MCYRSFVLVQWVALVIMIHTVLLLLLLLLLLLQLWTPAALQNTEAFHVIHLVDNSLSLWYTALDSHPS